MTRPDGQPKLPEAVSWGPLAYPMPKSRGKCSGKRVRVLNAFTLSIPFLPLPRPRGFEKGARLVRKRREADPPERHGKSHREVERRGEEGQL